MNTIFERLEEARRSVNSGIELAAITLKGSVEFRDAVEELLVGTPYEKPSNDRQDFDGLYGRLRNALKEKR